MGRKLRHCAPRQPTLSPLTLLALNILSLGDLLLDVTVRVDPASGEADTGPDAVRIGPGGSAANFAVWAARSGASTRFISRVGPDWEGEMLARSLRDEGVITSVFVKSVPTGRVLVMVDPQGNRRMYSYPGASRTLEPSDLDPAWFHNLSALHLTGYSFLRDGPSDAALEALRLARVTGNTLCTLDPNPGHLISDYGPARFRALLVQLQFDILFPNLDEGRLLSGKSDPQEIAGDWLELSPMVLLTLGEAGCLVARRNEDTFYKAAPPVETVVDATGAGDAFAAAFVVEYLRTHDAHAAAGAANQLAAQVVGKFGAR